MNGVADVARSDIDVDRTRLKAASVRKGKKSGRFVVHTCESAA